MKETLYTCPVCNQAGFYLRGLKAHRCPQKPLVKGKRQGLTSEEIQQACVPTVAVAVPAVSGDMEMMLRRLVRAVQSGDPAKAAARAHQAADLLKRKGTRNTFLRGQHILREARTPNPTQKHMKPTPEQITAEIAKLKEIKPTVLQRSHFGDNHHEAIDAQIDVLEKQREEEDVHDLHESAQEDGMDDDLYYEEHARDNALEAARWLAGEEENPPSSEWESLRR